MLELELRQSRDGSTARDEIDPARLSPRALALAEAVAGRSLRAKGDIRVLTDQADPLRPLLREAVMWSGWGYYPVDSPMDPHDYLEGQAAKFPDGWTVAPRTGEKWVVKQCAEFWGITPATWRKYVSDDRAPKSVDQLDGRTPLWDADEVRAWRRIGRGVRTDLAGKRSGN